MMFCRTAATNCTADAHACAPASFRASDLLCIADTVILTVSVFIFVLALLAVIVSVSVAIVLILVSIFLILAGILLVTKITKLPSGQFSACLSVFAAS